MADDRVIPEAEPDPEPAEAATVPDPAVEAEETPPTEPEIAQQHADGDDNVHPGSMSEYQLRKAWKQERDKRKAKALHEQQLMDENAKLQQRIEQLEQNVSGIIKTTRPDPMQFNTTDEFYQALDAWEQQNRPQPMPVEAPAAPPPPPPLAMNDDQEFHFYQCEQKLTPKLPDYDQCKMMVESRLKRLLNTDQDVIAALGISAHTYGLDPAKIIYALDKVPGASEQLAGVIHDPALTRMKLTELQDKIELGQKKKIESIPETPIAASGSLNSAQEAYNKAYDAYLQSSTLDNHLILKAARKKLRESEKKQQ